MGADGSSECDALRAEIANLQAALEHRDVIGQAKGILMVTLDCDADTAFDLLIKVSQNTNRKLFDVAADVANGGLRAVAATPPARGRRGLVSRQKQEP